ncbi:MAG: hypothetical protein H6760_00945 [Candidatus Nomurabacteria bacterium]|nr:MAG: hypothetical protein H6760_00945 [Candidatus Nomurabacteria bacterium]
MSNSLYHGLLSLILLAPYIATVQWRKAMSRKIFIWSVSGIIVLMCIQMSIQSVQLWNEYSNDPVAAYLLPPHSNVVYSHILRLGQPILVAVITALVTFSVLYFAKKYFRLGQYDAEDIRWLSLSALLSSWPGVLITFVSIFLIAVLAQIVRVLMAMRSSAEPPRLVLTPFVAPVTIFILWFLPDILHVTGLEKIRF